VRPGFGFPVENSNPGSNLPEQIRRRVAVLEQIIEHFLSRQPLHPDCIIYHLSLAVNTEFSACKVDSAHSQVALGAKAAVQFYFPVAEIVALFNCSIINIPQIDRFF
jgi:hypothetical protein